MRTSKFGTLTRFGKTTLAIAAMLCASSTVLAQAPDKSFAQMVKKFVLVPAGEPESEMLAKATRAVNFIQRMELPEASGAINEALQLAPRNAQLHFLNGFIYHLQAKQGDSQKNELAIEGYQQALRIDPGNWIAQEFLGLAYLDLRRFDDAKAQFADVLLVTPESTVSINGLMMASYLTGDAVTACLMADQYRQATAAPQAGFVRSSVSVYASCGQFDKADQMREQLSALHGDPSTVERTSRRLAQWKSLYRAHETNASALPALTATSTAPNASPLLLAQAFNMPTIKGGAPSRPAPTAAATEAAAKPAAPTADAAPAKPVAAKESADAGPRMVLVDVVLVSAQELISTSKGVNLLNALTLQLGAGTQPGFSRLVSSSVTGNAAATVSTAITRAITLPALAYTLNIANANSAFNEVLARPTLAAIEGMPSEFFSGTNLSAGVVSTSTQGGTTVVPLEKRFGIKLVITPKFLADDKVQLKVEAQRTSLNANADNPKVAYQVEIAEITANANVVMRIGDTLVLSGLSEKSSSNTRDGVPVLQDIPGVQYLFSSKKTNEIQRSVLILVTPRASAYTSRADNGQPNAASTRALREQFGFSGSQATNAEAVLAHLKTNALFREFREGDISLERWDRMSSTGERLRQALEFLYY